MANATAPVSQTKQILSDVAAGKSAPVYFLYGDEPFKVHEFLEKIEATLFGKKSGGDTTFSVDRLDGASSTGSDVLEAVQSMGLFGMGGGRRLVVVRQAHQIKEIESLAATLMDADGGSPWGDSVLILVADTLDGRRKFHQWLKKKGWALEFKQAKDGELLQWAQYLAKKLGATLSPDAAQHLAVISEGSLYRLASEIEKAWLYLGAGSNMTITAEAVAKVGAGQAAHQMVELVDAILAQKRTRSLLLTDKLIRSSEDALGLVGFLTWALKNNAEHSRDLKRVQELTRRLVELDSKLKSSGLDPQILVERFVLS